MTTTRVSVSLGRVIPRPPGRALPRDVLQRRAVQDDHVNGAALRVYLLLTLGMLSADEFAPVHADGLARSLSLHRANVFRALDELTDAGYLEAGPPRGRYRTFRLSPTGAYPLAPVAAVG